MHLKIASYLATYYLIPSLVYRAPHACDTTPHITSPPNWGNMTDPVRLSLNTTTSWEVSILLQAETITFSLVFLQNLLYIIITQCSLVLRGLITGSLTWNCFMSKNIFKHVILAELH